MSALDEYRSWTPPEPGLAGVVPRHLADAAIAELDAEVERLKCCGNCSWGSLEDFAFMCGHKNDDSVPGDWGGDVHADDPCHFTPSRWIACDEGGRES